MSAQDLPLPPSTQSILPDQSNHSTRDSTAQLSPHPQSSSTLDPSNPIPLPSSPPITNPPSNHSPPQQAPDNDDLNNSLSPQLSELASMFPQIQHSILDAVLAAHANDPSACVSDLLAMSDPNWKPSSLDVMAQSDAELARQIAFQDSHQPSIDDPSALPQQINLPYQPRIKKPTPLRPPQQWHQDTRSDQPESAGLSPSGKDEIQKIAEELGKLAETGKKAVSGWLNKAKTKMQEMQQPALSPPAEHLDSYQHVSAPSPNELAPRPAASSSAARSSRISPALPYASRYQTPAQPATPPPTRTTGSAAAPKAEGYKIDEPGSIGAGTSKPKEGSSTHTAMAGNQKAKDDDEESLEYTRNPFEDED